MTHDVKMYVPFPYGDRKRTSNNTIAKKQQFVSFNWNALGWAIGSFAFVFCLGDGESRSAFDGPKPLIARPCQRDSAYGPCDRKIYSAPSRRAAWRRRSGLSSIYMIRMGLRLVQMLGITRSRLTTVYKIWVLLGSLPRLTTQMDRYGL